MCVQSLEQVHRPICNKTGCVLRYIKTDISIYGCRKTPDSKTHRCSRRPKEAEDDDPIDKLTCGLCQIQSDAKTMFICADVYGHGCNKGFHHACFNPPQEALSSGESWFCAACQRDPKRGEDAARTDEAISLGRTRAKTKEQLVRRDTWNIEKLVDIWISAKVRCHSLCL